MGHFDRTLTYISDLQQADTPGAVCEKLLGVTSAFGLTALMAGTVPQPGTPTRRQKDHVLLCDWPVEWLERYVARNYVDHDPVVSRMKQLQAPFQWRDAAEEIKIDRGGEIVMGDAGEFKLKDGLAFPLVTLDGQIVMVSLGGEQIEMSGLEFGMISLVATYAIGRAMQLHTGAERDHRPHRTDAARARVPEMGRRRQVRMGDFADPRHIRAYLGEASAQRQVQAWRG